MALTFCGVFRELPLQRAAMEAEQPRGLGDVAAAFDEHPIDVLPLDPIERHRLERRRRRAVAEAPFERRDGGWLRCATTDRSNELVPSQGLGLARSCRLGAGGLPWVVASSVAASGT